jgi:SAM-dependent methyltransferase
VLNLNLGCSDQLYAGFIGVDRWTPPWATPENFQQADLRHSWPWADGSVDRIRCADIIEHLPDKIHTMNEIHRVLKPGGTVEIVVPTTEGRGAWQDPTHCSYWNRNSFFYHEAGNPHYERFHEAYGIRGAFRIVSEETQRLQDGVVKLAIVLAAAKAVPLEDRFMQVDSEALA